MTDVKGNLLVLILIINKIGLAEPQKFLKLQGFSSIKLGYGYLAHRVSKGRGNVC